MSHEDKSKLLNKVSPLLDGQVPDFVREDHPVFVSFLKDYFQFLEAGRLTVEPTDTYSRTVNYIRQETNTLEFILLEDGERLLTERGAGVLDASAGQFTNGETITGGTSNATATVLVEDSRNNHIYISSQQKFITGETITGGTSSAEAKITEYRANPIQNIQQLLDYADVDNTIYDFLDQMRESFMTAIPSTLATNTSKRNLLKNIKDLYSAKGTSEGHKLFMRLLLGEEAEIIYPNEYMMRPSDGSWKRDQIIRATAASGVASTELIGKSITGQTSGATALVREAITTSGSNIDESVEEFKIQDIVGTFTSGELITGTSNVSDIDVSFTIFNIVSDVTITNDGILHEVGEVINVSSLSSVSTASLKVNAIKSGSVSGVVVDDAGTGYQVGDILTFTNSSSDSNTDAATGVVSVVGGGILQETGTLDDSDVTTDTIILETDSLESVVESEIILEESVRDVFVADGQTTTFLINNSSTLTDTLTLYLDGVETEKLAKNGDTVWSVEDAPYLVLNGTDSSSTDAGDNILLEVDDAPQTGSVITLEQQAISLSSSPIDYTPANGTKIEIRGNTVNNLLLDATDGSSSNAGSKIQTDDGDITLDTYVTSTDQIILESGSFSVSEANSIHKARLTSNGRGYIDLPTITVTSVNGSSAKLLATTNDIGAIDSVDIVEGGLKYSESNPPNIFSRAHFVVKDVTGTFASGNTLTTHDGTVKGWDSSTQILDAEFEDVVRIDAEQSSTVNEGIKLETGVHSELTQFILEDTVDSIDSGDTITFNGTSIVSYQPKTVRRKVTVVENTLTTIAVSTTDATLGEKIFAIDGSYTSSDFTATPISFSRGDTYYFDLSDASLYNVDTTNNHELAFATLSDRFTGDGTSTTFTLEQSVGEKPIAFVVTGTTSFENNIRSYFDSTITAYTTNGNLIIFDSAPAANTHVLVFTKYTTGITTSDDYIAIGGGYSDYSSLNSGVTTTLDGAITPYGTELIFKDTTGFTSGSVHAGSALWPDLGEGVLIRIKIDNELFSGVLNGNTFKVGGRGNIGYGSGGVATSHDDGSTIELFMLNGTPIDQLTEDHGGAFVQIETTSATPNLYYYCVNHGPRMGFSILTKTVSDTIEDAGDSVLLNSESLGNKPKNILLENGSQDVSLTTTIPGTFDVLLETGHNVLISNTLEDYRLTLDNFVDTGKATRKSDGGLDFTISILLENGSGPIALDGLVDSSGRLLLEDHLSDGAGDHIMMENNDLVVLEEFSQSDTSGENGDLIIYEDAVNQEDRDFHVNNAFTHFLVKEDHDFAAGDAGGTSVLGLESGQPTSDSFPILLDATDSNGGDAGDKILIEEEVGATSFILQEEVELSSEPPNSFFEYEQYFSNPQHADENILLEDNRTTDTEVFHLLLNGTDSSSTDAGSRLVTETSGVTSDTVSQISGSVILNGTDSDQSDAGSKVLYDTEDSGFEEIVLNGTDSSSSNAGDNIILETAIDFSNNNIVITDSSGASATIVKADIAKITPTIDINKGEIGRYSGIKNLVGEDINRIQDSYYYQDYSYEVKVGQSLSTYINELKKAVHPIGFLPFGRVSIATSVSAAITTTAAGISDYTGDTDIFSPILASVLETLFSQTIQSRLQVVPTTTGIGQRDDQIVLENGIVAGDNLVLDASATSTDVGSNILLETNDGIDLEDGILEAILYESGSVSAEITNAATEGGGRVMAESSHAPSADAARFLDKKITTKISTAPNPRASRNLLLHLAKYPFGTVDSIQLETSTANQTSFLALDGEIPLAQETTFIILESGENVFLEQPSDEGQRIVAEMDTWAFPVGFKVSENERIVLEYENEFVETIPLSEIGDFRFEDIRAIDKIILGSDPTKSDGNELGGVVRLDGTDSNKTDNGDDILLEDNTDGSPLVTGDKLKLEEGLKFAINVDQDNANAVENVGILMENFGQLLLDGTDSSSTNAGSFLAQETTKNNRFTLEESGSLIVEENSTYSVVDNLISESALEETIILEDFFNPRNTFGIRLEQDSYNEDVIILDGTDSNSTNAGIKLELEEYFQSGQETRQARILLEDFEHLLMETGDFVGMENETITVFTGDFKTSAIQLETANIVSSKGQIPLGNWTLNSSTSPVGYQSVVHASEIRVRSTGEIALEDSTDTTYGYLVLNGTDSSSTNAGDNIDCEGATGIAA